MANEYRVTQVAAEVLRDGPAEARVTQVAAEVLRSVADVPAPPSGRKGAALLVAG